MTEIQRIDGGHGSGLFVQITTKATNGGVGMVSDWIELGPDGHSDLGIGDHEIEVLTATLTALETTGAFVMSFEDDGRGYEMAYSLHPEKVTP